MTNQSVQVKSPQVLLQEQTESLQEILQQQKATAQYQYQIVKLEQDWYKYFLDEQQKQTKHLANISHAATIYLILVVLSLCIGGFLFLSSFSTLLP